jgi:hypothetical protein
MRTSMLAVPAAGAPVAWRQTGEEVTLEAACPRELSRKDVLCLFTTHSVHLEAAGRVIADGQLFAPIAPDECCWEFGSAPRCASSRACLPQLFCKLAWSKRMSCCSAW